MVDLSHLNQEQLKAATHDTGPAVIYAGAGSGKTRVICHRVAWLIEQGVLPSRIMCVTFTNKAAREMKERIQKVAPAGATGIQVSTFHSTCAKFLRIFTKEAGYQEGFSIYDDSDQKTVLKTVIKRLNIPDKILTTSQLKYHFDSLKNQGFTPETLKEDIEKHPDEGSRHMELSGLAYSNALPDSPDKILLTCYELYTSLMKQQNAMDFGDLILQMVKLLEKDESVLAMMQRRYSYFMVDEFQDTNPIQFRLMELLSSHTNNLVIVGDDDQSIYSWRGAEPQFILNFHKKFDDVKVFKLEQNYRSTQKIVNSAMNLICSNVQRADKKLFTENTEGEPIDIAGFQEPSAEAQWICKQVMGGLKEGSQLSDYAVLYRTNAQSRALEDAFRRHMVPYVIYGSVRFYERAEIKDLLSYLKLLVNPHDDASFLRAINTPRRSVGPKAVSLLQEIAVGNQLSLAQAAFRVAHGEINANLGRGLKGVTLFTDLMGVLYTKLQTTNSPAEVLKQLLSSVEYSAHLTKTYAEDSEDRILNVKELLRAFEEYGDKNPGTSGKDLLVNFLEEATLTVEPKRNQVEEGSAEAITLMTIHAAKGLEFKKVFVSGLDEGTLPHANSSDDPTQLEEERRLLYVAMTRAQEHLSITYSRTHRFRRGMPVSKSRFLRELPEDNLLDVFGDTFRKVRKPINNLDNLFEKIRDNPKLKEASHLSVVKEPEEDEVTWKNGMLVMHRIFGQGKITEVEPARDGYKLQILFPQAGYKTIMDRFVKPI